MVLWWCRLWGTTTVVVVIVDVDCVMVIGVVVVINVMVVVNVIVGWCVAVMVVDVGGERER